MHNHTYHKNNATGKIHSERQLMKGHSHITHTTEKWCELNTYCIQS